MSKVARLSIALLPVAFLAACGGSSSSSSGGRGSVPPPGGGGNGGAANPPVVVNVGASQPASGVDIDVPASSPAPNAELLGATAVPSGGGSVSISLSNTGATVKRGTSYVVALIGDGLSSNMTIAISGPSDITIDTTTVKGFTATNGKPGLSFQAAISPNAVLGARTVLLKNAQSDITSFTGGLEVVQ